MLPTIRAFFTVHLEDHTPVLLLINEILLSRQTLMQANQGADAMVKILFILTGEETIILRQ